MDYFKIFNFNREPFSNSPDPDFFFHSRQHVGYLQKLELAIRLRRGLNVVIGDVGTGKTTLCRQLIRKFADADDVQTHLLLDPYFNSSLEFLSTLTEMFGIPEPETGATEWRFRELIKKYFFRLGVDEEKTVVLIIDEGQKIPDFCLEILREFLNYEINEHKLLQIIIFAQKEFEQTINEHANFADRINIRLFLGPLDFKETREMILFRLARATEHGKPPSILSYMALWAVYRATGGYPRKIINLCHQILLALIIQNRYRAGWLMVRSCIERISTGRQRQLRMRHKAVVAGLIGLAAILALSPFADQLKAWLSRHSDLKPVSIIAPSEIENFPVQDKDEVGDDAGSSKIDDDIQPSAYENQSPNQSITESINHRITEYDAEYKSESTNQPINELPTHQLTKYKTFAKSSNTNNFPVLLGKIKAKHGETVLEMIYKVYGLPRKFHLRQIILAVRQLNPQIDNLDTIYVGSAINFPAVPTVPAIASTVPEEGWWVEAVKCETLEETYNFVRFYTYASFNLRILPYWNKREGMNFVVLLRNCFIDEESAQQAIAGLPKVVAANAKIVNKWEKDTVFFSNLPKEPTKRKDVS